MVKKKRFLCGHVGFGKWCHRCDRADDVKKLLAAHKGKAPTKVSTALAAELAFLVAVPVSQWKNVPDFKMNGSKK